MSEHRDVIANSDGEATGKRVSMEAQVTHLTEENARLKQELQRLTELWQRDRETMVALMLRGFPRTEEELQAALKSSEPFSTVLSELFPEHSAKA